MQASITTDQTDISVDTGELIRRLEKFDQLCRTSCAIRNRYGPQVVALCTRYVFGAPIVPDALTMPGHTASRSRIQHTSRDSFATRHSYLIASIRAFRGQSFFENILASSASSVA